MLKLIFFVTLKKLVRAVIVAQLVERSLLIPEDRGSNPVIGKKLCVYICVRQCIGKTKIKKKRPGMAHLKNSASTRYVHDVQWSCYAQQLCTIP